MTRTPRQPVHRGSVEASGVFIAAGSGGEASLRERALSVWVEGAEVHRLEGGLVVLFPVPRRMFTRAAPGAPLVRQGTWLCAAPLAPDELEALDPLPGSVVLVREGVARARPIGGATREEPARWLELAPYATARVRSLGVAPEPVPESLPEVRLSLRERLSVPASPGSAEAAESLRLAAEAGASSAARGLRDAAGRVLEALARFISGRSPQPDAPAQPSRGRVLTRPSWRSRLGHWLARFLPGAAAAAATHDQPGRRVVDVPAPGPSWRSRLGDWLHRLAVRTALASGLARILGARQADYFRRMMRFFEEDDLDQALRHAIPLGGSSGVARPALGVPRPRDDLHISLGRRDPGSAVGIGVGDELMNALRAL